MSRRRPEWTILSALADDRVFARWFAGPSWHAWQVFLGSLFGLPINEADVELFVQCTGRTTPQRAPAREGWVVVGRRGGKSRIAALVAVFIACFRDHRPHLAPGEVATIAVIAADRRQARVVMRYITSFIDALVTAGFKFDGIKKSREAIELPSVRVAIEVHTASFRLTRGYTLAAVVCDEVAFWRSEDAAEPDVEILNGLRPGLATIPGALLLCISTGYARKGALWSAFREHFAKDNDPILVWKSDTLTMNPTVDRTVIEQAYAEDPSAAEAEFGGGFRTDIESFVSLDAAAACVVPGRRELPAMRNAARYVMAVDLSGGGGGDCSAAAVAHVSGERRSVLDAVLEIFPPFDPEEVAAQFAELARRYGITKVLGDRFGGEWPRERFRAHRIAYEVCEKTRSDYYSELLPLLNSKRVELLDNRRLLHQLVSLERRTGRTGKDVINHPVGPRFHDDLINSAAIALVTAYKPVVVPMARRAGNWADLPLPAPAPVAAGPSLRETYGANFERLGKW